MAAVDHPPVTARTRRLLGLLLVPMLVVVAIGAVVLWPTGGTLTTFRANGSLVDATVVALRDVACTDTAPEASVSCTRAEVRLTGAGRVAVQERPSLTGLHLDLDVGDHVVVRRNVATDGTPTYELAGYRRGRTTAVLAAVAALLLVLVARRRGLQLLVALGASGVVLLVFTIPAAKRDGSPVGIALVSAALVAIALLLLGRGLKVRSVTALIGTLAGLGVAGALAHLAVVGGRLGGIDADPLDVRLVPDRPLLLAGVVIAAVAAIAQVAVDVVDATWDLRDASAAAGWRGVARAGLVRARDRVAATAATLTLVYAGTSLVVLVAFTAKGADVVDVLSLEPVALVVLGALVGIIGLLVAAPLTAALASLVVVREAGHRGPDDPRRFRSRAERDIWEDDGR